MLPALSLYTKKHLRHIEIDMRHIDKFTIHHLHERESDRLCYLSDIYAITLRNGEEFLAEIANDEGVRFQHNSGIYYDQYAGTTIRTTIKIDQSLAQEILVKCEEYLETLEY